MIWIRQGHYPPAAYLIYTDFAIHNSRIHNTVCKLLPPGLTDSGCGLFCVAGLFLAAVQKADYNIHGGCAETLVLEFSLAANCAAPMNFIRIYFWSMKLANFSRYFLFFEGALAVETP
jgi:hypothetical protein